MLPGITGGMGKTLEVWRNVYREFAQNQEMYICSAVGYDESPRVMLSVKLWGK